MSQARGVISDIEKVGGCLTLEENGAIHYRVPKNNPRAQDLVELVRASREEIIKALRERAAACSAASPRSASRLTAQGASKVASCGSLHCAGCYEVAPGVQIHPPKCGEDYRMWLERWEARCKVQ